MNKVLAAIFLLMAGYAFAQPVAQPKNQVMATPSGVNGFLAPRRMTAGDLPSVTPQYFGAVCDGVTDDAAALTAWAAALTTGKTGYVSGTCVTSVPIVLPIANNVSIIGDGAGASSIKYTGSSTTNDILVIGDQTAAVATIGLSIRGLRVSSSTVMTGGAGVHLYRIGQGYLEDVWIDSTFGSNLFNGLYIDRGGNISIVGSNFRAINDAVRLSGTAALPLTDVFFSGGKIANSAVGLHIGGGVGGFVYEMGDIIQNNTNVLIDSALTSTRNFQLQFGSGSFIDGSLIGPNVDVQDTLGITFNSMLMFNNGWVASANTHGINIASGVAYTVTFSGGQINNNHNDGIRNASTTALIAIGGTYIANNGVASSSGFGVNNTVSNLNLTTHGVSYVGNFSGRSAGVVDGGTVVPGGELDTGTLVLQRDTPQIQWRNAGTAPADSNNWQIFAQGSTGNLFHRTCNDALSICNAWLTVTRTGAVATLATITPNTAITGTFAVTGTSSFTGVITPTGGILGKTDASSAAAGNLGQVIESSIAPGSAVSLTSPNAANVTSVSLTAGDWECEGNVQFYPNTSTTQTRVRAWISLTTATIPTAPNAGAFADLQTTIAAGLDQSLTVGRFRVNVASTTTVFLSAAATFAVSTETAGGYIGCRRIR